MSWQHPRGARPALYLAYHAANREQQSEFGVDRLEVAHTRSLVRALASALHPSPATGSCSLGGSGRPEVEEAQIRCHERVEPLGGDRCSPGF